MKERNVSTEQRRRRRWQNVVRVMAAIVVFCTTYALILPALTMESQLICELPEHTHTDACWEQRRVIDEQVLTCTEHEHIHNEDCYEAVRIEVCGSTEDDHVHTGDCYETRYKLTCTERMHMHSEDCYEVVREHTEWVCTCGMEEHTHTPQCYDAIAAQGDGFYCGEVEHTHGGSCYDPDGTLCCTMKEHTHSLACTANPSADLETEEVWGRALEAVPMTGDWAQDVLLVAQSQMGYVESAANFRITEEDGIRGYSRYGAWYGRPYDAWDAMFVEFCLHYAGVSYPAGGSAAELAEVLALPSCGYFRTAETAPQPGELIFFGTDGAERVGIVWEATEDSVRVIAGDRDDSVRAEEYSLSDPEIYGYASLPEQLRMQTARVENPLLNAGALGAAPASGEVVVVGHNPNTNKYYALTDDGGSVEVDYNPATNAVSNASANAIWNRAGNTLRGKGNNNKFVSPGKDNSAPVGSSATSSVIIEEDNNVAVYSPNYNKKKIESYNVLQFSAATNTFSVQTVSAEPAPMLLMAMPLGATGDDPGTGGGGGAVVEGGASDTDYIGTVPDTNNGWQIVEEQYGSETVKYYKTGTDGTSTLATSTTMVTYPSGLQVPSDAEIAIKKRLVPTGVENEFLVYLSIDKRTSMEQVIQKSELWTTQSPGNGVPVGSITTLNTGSGSTTQFYKDPPSGTVYPVHVIIHFYDTVTLVDGVPTVTGNELYTFSGDYYRTKSKCSNGAIYLGLNATQYVLLQSYVTFKDSGGSGMQAEIYLGVEDARINLDFLQTVLGGTSESTSGTETLPNGVTDIIGSQFEFLGEDTIVADGSVDVDTSGDNPVLVWNPAENKNAVTTQKMENNTIYGWTEDACRLVYRVRLKTEEGTDFEPDTPYDSNVSANLTYSRVPCENASSAVETITGLLAEFPVPSAKGLLYDIDFTKKSSATNAALANVTFGLYESDGTTQIGTVTTDNTGQVQFPNLPAGTYVLKETIPNGYTVPASASVSGNVASWTIHLDITSHSGDLTNGSGGKKIFVGTPVGSTRTLINTRSTSGGQNLKLVKTDESGNFLAGAVFTLYEDNTKTTAVTNWAGLTSNSTDGVFSPTADSYLPQSTYYLYETQAPPGYLLPTGPIEIDVSATGVTYKLPGETSAQSATQDGGEYVVTVVNRSGGGVLPATGGIGLPTVYALGVLIPMSAFVYCRKSRRRSEGRPQ